MIKLNRPLEWQGSLYSNENYLCLYERKLGNPVIQTFRGIYC
jgi:hypothetical protein